jgi:hypothetical protein
MPEPTEGAISILVICNKTAEQVFKYHTFIAILSVLLHRHDSHPSKWQTQQAKEKLIL